MRAEIPVFRLEHPKRCWHKHTVNFGMVWSHMGVDGKLDLGGVQPPYFAGNLVLTCSNSQYAPCWCLTKTKTMSSRFSPSQTWSQIWRSFLGRRKSSRYRFYFVERPVGAIAHCYWPWFRTFRAILGAKSPVWHFLDENLWVNICILALNFTWVNKVV